MTLYFITGAEGVGKSSILNSLKNEFPDFEVYDFDEAGVPENPSLQWRLNTTQHWINNAIKNQGNGKSTIVVGLAFPKEVEEFEEHTKLDKIKFLLMDISQEERARRLSDKGAEGVISDTRQLEKLGSEFKGISFENEILDVTKLSKEETVKEVLDWIRNH